MKFTLRSLFLDTAVAALIIVAAKGASHPYSFTVFMALEYIALRCCLSPSATPPEPSESHREP